MLSQRVVFWLRGRHTTFTMSGLQKRLVVDGGKLYEFLERNTNLWEFPCVWVYGKTLEILNETVKGVLYKN